MLAEADLERACRAAARGVAPKPKRRRRPRAVPVDAKDSWTVAGSCAPTFWPRFLDICLVAAGVRCAVLLDSRRTPRRSPPLASVLLALQQDQQQQQQQQQQQHHDHICVDGCGYCSSSCDVACLGLLVLEGSYFLVNRVMLLQRLEDFSSVESTAAGKVEHFGRAPAAASTAECTSSRCGVPRDPRAGEGVGVAAVGPSSERQSYRPAPPAGNGSAAARRQRQGLRRDFALVDVSKSLASSPCDRSDFLVPKLHAALRSAFGDVAAVAAAAAAAASSSSVQRDPTSLTADSSPPPGTTPSNSHRESTATAEATAKNNGEGRRSSGDSSGEFCLAPREEEEGARWLRDWGMKEMLLDCESLREILGDVGLPGLAGWLLEYPVIYCCPSLVVGTNDNNRGEDGDDDALLAGGGGGGGGGTETEHAMGNCLAAVPLTVYSLSFEIDDKEPGCCSPRMPLGTPSAATGTSSQQAFSFSVPETVCGTEAGEEKEGTKTGLHGLVGSFLERLESRIARHRSSGNGCCCGRHRHLVHGLTVTDRTETLDRVAL